MRAGYQELAVKGLMTFEELGVRLKEVEGTRRAARRELETLKGKRAELRDLEQDIATLLKACAEAVPGKLDKLTPEGRHHVYKVLRLGCVLRSQGPPELTGVFVANAPKFVRKKVDAGVSHRSDNRFVGRGAKPVGHIDAGTSVLIAVGGNLLDE